MSNFYGTEIELWAGFGPVGNTEKKNWADYKQGRVFSRFYRQIFFKNIVASTIKSCIK